MVGRLSNPYVGLREVGLGGDVLSHALHIVVAALQLALRNKVNVMIRGFRSIFGS
jgi:hypothetical protein